jgi:hypothetical protein
MTQQKGSPTSIYHICVRSILDEGWVRTLQVDPIATHRHYAGLPRTTLTLQVSDQSQLLGLLNQLHNMGLTLLSVELNLPRATQIGIQQGDER